MTTQLMPTKPRASAPGDVGMVEDLFRKHYADLVRFAVKLAGGDRLWAEDIAQETLFRAAGRIREVAARYGAGRSWLFLTARRISVDGYRARSARPIEALTSTFDERHRDDDQIDRALTKLDLKRALAALRPRHREILVNIYLRDCTLEETAAALGVPIGTVKSRVHYALRSLRESMGVRGAGIP